VSSDPQTDDPVVLALRRLEVLVAINGRRRILLGRGEAAESRGISLRHFHSEVAPHVPFVQIGKRILYRPADLERWADGAQEHRPQRRGPRA
jgi:hypothetical protein